MSEPEDFVVCRICGANRQLLSRHHFESKNCRAAQEKLGIFVINSKEYKKIFPNVRTSSLKYTRRMIETRHKNDPEKLRYYKTWKTRRDKYGSSGIKDIENFRKMRSVVNKRVMLQMSPEKQERRAKKIGKRVKQIWDSYTPEEKAERVYNIRTARHDISEQRKQEITQKIIATRRKNDPTGDSWKRAQKTRDRTDPQGLRFIKCVKTRWERHPDWFRNPSEAKINITAAQIRFWSLRTPEQFREVSRKQIAYWQSLSQEEKASRIRNSFGKAVLRPNISEKKLIPMLEPFGFTYTGGGPSKIPGRRPDFTHTIYKMLIEFDGAGGHNSAIPWIPENVKELDDQRDRDYKKEGWEILRILPEDLKKGRLYIQQKVKEWMISLGHTIEWEIIDARRWFR